MEAPRPHALTHPEEFITPEMYKPDPPRKKFDPRTIPGYGKKRKTAAEFRAQAFARAGITADALTNGTAQSKGKRGPAANGDTAHGTLKEMRGGSALAGPSAGMRGSPRGWGVLECLRRRWRGGKGVAGGRRQAAWWRKRTLATIAVAMTIEGTVGQLVAMTPGEVRRLEGRMPKVAWRRVSEWLEIRGDARGGSWLSRGRRVLEPAVIRASVRVCGFGLGALLRVRRAS